VSYVHVKINRAVTDLSRENTNFLLIFMGGWIRYALENPDDQVEVNGYFAGIESILKVYRKGNRVKEDNAVLELIKIQETGKLREWVEKQL
jgi:uncharacterized membrane protein